MTEEAKGKVVVAEKQKLILNQKAPLFHSINTQRNDLIYCHSFPRYFPLSKGSNVCKAECTPCSAPDSCTSGFHSRRFMSCLTQTFLRGPATGHSRTSW